MSVNMIAANLRVSGAAAKGLLLSWRRLSGGYAVAVNRHGPSSVDLWAKGQGEIYM